MSGYEENYLAKRPNLCKMCGLCCRVATTPIPYEKLKQMQAEGDQGAVDFLSIFEPYPSIDDARKVAPQVVDNIIEGLKSDGEYENYELTFYCCKYLKEDNSCSNYENRPALCRHFPSSPWAVVPPECGYEGWLFEKREEIKQKIRKTKEDLIELEILKKRNITPSTMTKIEAVERKMMASIEMYSKYGSENW